MNSQEDAHTDNSASNDDDALGILEKNVEAMATVDPSHKRQTSAPHLIESVGHSLEHPAYFVLIAIVVTAWIGVNLFGGKIGLAPFDPPPFPWLQGCVTLASLVTTVVVLVKQGAMARRDRRRDRVQLQLTMLTEQKAAKLIALIEELRRDLPDVENRRDAEAELLGKTIHPQKVLDTIQQNLEEE